MLLDELRARIREIEGHSVEVQRKPSGVAVLDQLIGGLPCPGLVEIYGAPGGGRSALALLLTAEVHRQNQWVAWVDLDRKFYPPAARLLGVELRRLALVRPVADRGIWATEQVIRSGCFPLVVILGHLAHGRAGQRFSHAAERGQCCVLLLHERQDKRVPASVRLSMNQRSITVLRNRGGPIGGIASLPAQEMGLNE